MVGQLYVVGIGPGAVDKMTIEARETLMQCPIIVGYTVYVDLIRGEFPDKEFITTAMKQEEERCRVALSKASEGKCVAVVCSGDAGVYGMAGIILELQESMQLTEQVEVHVVAGVTAALSGAAVLGAPLGHDFAVISLSDLLTPFEKIEKRIEYAAMADLAICIYNPSSKKRADYLRQMCNLVLKHQPEDLVCGYVTNIGREGECAKILSLKELKETQVDMFTTVFIGNSQTKRIGNRMVTPRGYRLEKSDL